MFSIFFIKYTFKTKQDKFIEFNHMYSNINLNLYLCIKYNYKISTFFKN